MVYTNGSVVITESADILTGDLAAPFFTPVIMEVETDAPDGLIDDNPDVFDFEFEGISYTGISMENSINLGTNKKQTYQMLSVPENQLEKLIDYYG